MSDTGHFWHDFLERPIIWEEGREPDGANPPINMVPIEAEPEVTAGQPEPTPAVPSSDPFEGRLLDDPVIVANADIVDAVAIVLDAQDDIDPVDNDDDIENDDGGMAIADAGADDSTSAAEA